MSYRITNIEKWKDLWFSNLSPNAKLLFFYFVENCDNAGFFEVNKKFMLFYTGLNEQELMDAGTELKKSYIKSQDGTKLWFKNFLKYQKKIPLNLTTNVHRQIINLLLLNLSDETKFKGNPLINSMLPAELQIQQGIARTTRRKKEVSEENNSEETPIAKRVNFVKPTIKEVFDYMVENEFEFAKVESEKFVNFYESKGWKIGKNTMKIWRSAVANWMKYYYERHKIQTPKLSKLEVIQQSHASFEEINWDEVYKEPTNEQFN
jgi:hypothetical protein